MVCVVRSMFAFVEKRLCCVYANTLEAGRGKMPSRIGMIAVFFILFFFPINITPSRSFGACGFQEIIRVERRKIGSVCICGERIYGERSEK